MSNNPSSGPGEGQSNEVRAELLRHSTQGFANELDRFVFGPRGERHDRLRSSYSPEDTEHALVGKSVLTVIGGDYPGFFLAEGAARVESFDTSELATTWSVVQREVLRKFDYEQGRDFFAADMTAAEIDERLISGGFSDVFRALYGGAYPSDGGLALEMYGSYLSNLRDERAGDPTTTILPFESGDSANEWHYAFFANETRYDRAAAATRADGWTIERTDLETIIVNAAEEGRAHDLMYVSNIPWYMNSIARKAVMEVASDPVVVQGEIDRQIAGLYMNIVRTSEQVVNPGGMIFETHGTPHFSLPLDDSVWNSKTYDMQSGELAISEGPTQSSVAGVNAYTVYERQL